ncbi:hypothetical protein [Streptomyces luteocolor]|uniref:hypothetical protein n=1 Tax=Streptomyces luteocolor TaxID=285500 RepID=UPI000853EE95|nr:hypothetical protein [Streptomyces luteocolor]
MRQPLKFPISDAVAAFGVQHRPAGVFEAAVQMADAERELGRLRPLGSVEDQGDRETVLGLYAQADKVLSAHAERVGSELRSLS